MSNKESRQTAGYIDYTKKVNRATGAFSPDWTILEIASELEKIDTGMSLNPDDELETQLWIARMLGEMFTGREILRHAKSQGRHEITIELISSIKHHRRWKEAIIKFRSNWLASLYEEMPLSHIKVRLRELTDLYYKLTGKHVDIKYKLDNDGTLIEATSEDVVNSFDLATAHVEVSMGGKEGKKVTIKGMKYFSEATKILEQIRVELEKADTSMLKDSQYMKMMQECGFEEFNS